MSLRQDKINHLKEFTTFEDIFALALARSSKERFSAISEQWCDAMYEVWSRYASEVPELRDIYFSKRPPLPPQSDQVYQIFTTLAKAGEMSLPNPQFGHIKVEKQHKRRIRNAIGDSLNRYEGIIGNIVQILEEKLATK